MSDIHTKIIKKIKENVKSLPCPNLPKPKVFLIVEIDAFDIGYGGILKNCLPDFQKLINSQTSFGYLARSSSQLL